MSRGKTWVYWYKQVSKTSAALFREEDATDSQSPWHLCQADGDTLVVLMNDQAEMACNEFVRSRNWPCMTDAVRFAVWVRLDTAFAFVDRLCAVFNDRTRVVVRPPDLSITPEMDVWRFLLIEYWKEAFEIIKARTTRRQ